MTAVVEAFKANGARVILGSAGCVGKRPGWSKSHDSTEELNLSLCTLRNIDVEIANQERVGFADVFMAMLTAGAAAQERYGVDYAIASGDGVHPDWAGHTVMAYVFLRAFGLKGEIGTFTVNLRRNTMKVSPGHEVVVSKDGEFEIKSKRYPFCPCVPGEPGRAGYPICGKDQPSDFKTISSAMTLIPFNQDLNRLMLIARNGKAGNYKVTWGASSQTFSAKQLEEGVNLAEAFPANPFSEAFGKVDAAVVAKQAYETKQIKERFRSQAAKEDIEAVAAETEKERTPLADAIKAAFVPVTHTLRIEPE